MEECLTDSKIDVIFITKPGCGICMMMKPAWDRIMAERLDWHYFHYNIGVDSEAAVIVSEFPQNDNKLPMFCVYRGNEPIGFVSGGHRYRDIIMMIEDIIRANQEGNKDE